MGRLKTLWTNIHTSLWLVPVLMILAAMGLAFCIVEVDAAFSLELQQAFPRFFGINATGSRTILSTIAASVIAVAGVTFSVTIVSLSLAASQYTSRVLRNFMRDRSNQVVLGTLVSIFIYCLIVLRTVQDGSEGSEAFVPSLSIMVAIVLAVGAILAFIYFIHHVATIIQASTIIQGIARETNGAIGNLFPDEIGEDDKDPAGTDEEMAVLRDRRWQTIPARETGYIQNVEPASLLSFAREHDCVLRVERCVGDFVSSDSPLVSILGPSLDERQTRKLCESVGIASYRSIEQDPAYGIRQIVDIALKALSPGINDPTTAKTCIDYLGSILRGLVRKGIPSPFRYHEGKLRVIAFGPTFEDFVDKTFHEIRQNGSDDVSVMIRLLDTMEGLAGGDVPRRRKAYLLGHAGLIYGQAEQDLAFEPDRILLKRHLDRATAALQAGG
jgi:uncharacterized membrane protein